VFKKASIADNIRVLFRKKNQKNSKDGFLSWTGMNLIKVLIADPN